MRAPLAALLAALIAAAPTAEAEASERLAFRVDLGILSVARGELNIRRDGPVTRMNGAATAFGLGALFSSFSVRNSVHYLADGSRRVKVEVISGSDRSLRDMAWAADGTPVVLAAGEEDPDGGPLTPIPAGETQDTVDPFFPILDMMARLDKGLDCAGTYRIYDGTRRYNLRFADLGTAELNGDRNWTYSGPANRCSMHFIPVGGFEQDREFTEDEIDRQIWFARFDERFVPVRFAVDWALGTAVARIDLDTAR
ncbi:MAG: DUF3108 domain-containing protein [Pseudomonadota bacterium]